MEGERKIPGQKREELLENWVLGEIMDSIGAYVYVTDVETDEILFMNRAMKEAFSLEQPEGKVCWQVLQKGMERRCEFCPRQILREGADPYFWEETNTKTGRVYENYDSLIHWTDGRLAHVQQSIDITERKKLVAEAEVDELTGVLNRRAGRIAFEAMKKKAHSEAVPFTLCMYDLNDLKRVNDSFGHSEGDNYLQICAGAMQKGLSPEDVFFRMSGDEFIILMYGCGEREASKRMQEAQRLAEQGTARSGEAAELLPGFSYGVFELGSDENIGFQAAFDEADARMYVQKRKRHIQWAEKRAAQMKPAEKVAAADFEYDQSLLYDALVKSTEDYIYLCNMKTGMFRYPKSMVEEFDLPGEVLQLSLIHI